MTGNVEVIKVLEDAGKDIPKAHMCTIGPIGLSKKHKNIMISNIVGACAYWGNQEALEYCMKRIPFGLINYIEDFTKEEPDRVTN